MSYESHTDWERDLRPVLERYIDNDDAVAVCITFFNMIKVVEKNTEGEADPAGSVKWLMDWVFMLPRNEFMAQHGAAILAEFQGRVADWFRALQYAPTQTDPRTREANASIQMIGLRESYKWIADAVLRRVDTTPDYFRKSFEMGQEIGRLPL